MSAKEIEHMADRIIETFDYNGDRILERADFHFLINCMGLEFWRVQEMLADFGVIRIVLLALAHAARRAQNAAGDNIHAHV